MMKIPYFLMMIAVAALMLGGCSSPTESAGAPENHAQQAADLKAIPPQAQQAANQQTQQKAQMDAMRAKDAAKSGTP